MSAESKQSTDASKKRTAAASNNSPKAVEAAKKATREIANGPKRSGRRIPDQD